MPIPLPPQTFTCPACKWQRTTIPASDVLMPGFNWFDHCPVCDNKDITQQPASTTEIIKARLAGFFQNKTED